jgi:HTH-type transcriptional regulator / antitoxin HigA
MISTTALRAAKKFGPGYFIKEQLELREWTQDDLASITGMSAKHINKILQDQQSLTLDNARLFAEVFDTSIEYWVNLNTAYQLWLRQEKTKQELEVDTKAMIYERMPVKDMIKKGWLKPVKETNELAMEVMTFFNLPSLNFSIIDQNYQPFLARKSESYNQFNAAYAYSWFQKAKTEAGKISTNPYQKEALEDLLGQLHQYTIKENGINQFLDKLAEIGVVFMVLPHLQKTYLDGAAFVSGSNPVVVYTGRYNRIDNFWFTIVHEIAHVLLHLNEETTYFLDDLKEKSSDVLETEANALAAKVLKHDQILAMLEKRSKYLSPKLVQDCADELQIHPAIVIGKLAHDKLISFANQNRYKSDVLELIDLKWKI